MVSMIPPSNDGALGWAPPEIFPGGAGTNERQGLADWNVPAFERTPAGDRTFLVAEPESSWRAF
jgi:hypothetical protein